MSVESILRSKGDEVVTIHPSAKMKMAANVMRSRKIGALVVLEEDSVVGIVSECDIVQAIADHGGDGISIEVSDLMKRNVVSCKSQDTLKSVMKLMTQHRMRHLPVIDDGKLAGLVSIGDVVKNRLEEMELESGVLRDAYIAKG